MRFLLAICLIAYASALDCSTGQTTWCSSLRAAKECGAVNHCTDTVWKNAKLNKDSSDVCSYCESVVKDVQNMLTDKETQEKIQNFLKSACTVIPDSDMRKECNTVVDQDLPELLMLISAELDPQLVCNAIGLCRSSKLFAMQPMNSLKKLQATGDICADCKTFFGDMKAEITSKTTEEELIQEINGMFCSQLGELEQTCKTMVAAYIPEIMQMLAADFDPSMECSAFGFCPVTAESNILLPKLKLSKSPLFTQIKANDDQYCDYCKLVITEAKTLATSTEVEAPIEQLLDELCNNLGEYKETCIETVKTYLPEILQLLTSELDPDVDCKALGLCTAEQQQVQPMIDLEPASVKITHEDIVAMQQSGPKMTRVDASVQCILCEYVMTEIDQLLTENATEAEIIAALDQVCSLLPDTVSSECNDFVTTYGPAVLALLQQELDPKRICTTLGLCSPAAVEDVTGDELCIVCQTLIQYVDSLLAKNATEKEIQQALDKVCNFLPTTFKAECDSIVQQYSPLLVKLLQMELTPNEVCTEIKLCGSEIEPTKAPLLGESECSWGPAYWCASRDNAEKCNAAAHCEKHVWN